MFILPSASGGVGRGRRCLQRGWNRSSAVQKGELRALWQEATWNVQQLLPHHFPALLDLFRLSTVLGWKLNVDFMEAGLMRPFRTEQCVSCFCGAESGWSEKAVPGGKSWSQGQCPEDCLSLNKTLPGLSPACCTCSF